MKLSRLFLVAVFPLPNLAIAQDGIGFHKPNYLVGVLALLAIAAAMSLGERRFFSTFLRTSWQLLGLAFVCALLMAALHHLDIAFGKHPIIVLVAVVACAALLLKAIRWRQQRPKPDA
jgi:hypothetical protein